MREKLTHYIRAGYAGLYLVSHEEQRVEAELKAIAATLKHRLYAWSATAGLLDTADGTSRGAQDPMEVLGVPGRAARGQHRAAARLPPVLR